MTEGMADGMKKISGKYLVNYRMKLIFLCIILLFFFVFIVTNYVFKISKEMLLEKEADVVSQFLDRNELALTDAIDSIRKLSAASSTNRALAEELDQDYTGSPFSSENVNRITAVQDTLMFYRNIFFDYRMHYVIIGSDDTVYGVVDGVDNSSYFSGNLASSTVLQSWYQEFMEGSEAAKWVSPCVYSKIGEYQTEKISGTDEEYLLFVRKIRKYVNQKDLGVSIISFPTANFDRIISPYTGSSLAIYNEDNQLVYQNGEDPVFLEFNAAELERASKDNRGYFYTRLSESNYLVNYMSLEALGWKLINATPVNEMTRAIDRFYSSVTVLMGCIAVGAAIMCLLMYLFVSAPLNRVIMKVSAVNIGGTTVSDLRKTQYVGYGIKEAEKQINHMIDYIEELSAQTIKQKEIEERLKYEMLRAQLNPHFLFNTLNTIKWSAMISGASNIAGMITSLGILLENTMNRKAEEVTLKEEIKVVKAWVEIKNWALKDRVKMEVQIPGELEEFMVIRFFLQPIVENSVLHGMGNVDNGHILITAAQDDTSITIAVRDNGVGIKEETLKLLYEELDGDSKKRHVTGIGLASINELIKIRYGRNYGLTVESVYGQGTVVKAAFPKIREKEIVC